MAFMIGFCFALRSGEEHRRLCHKPLQLQLVEIPGYMPYLRCKENIFKTNQAGSSHCKVVPKELIHYTNTQNPKKALDASLPKVQFTLST